MPRNRPLDTQTTRTSLRLRADVLNAADRLAAFNGVTRSDILRTAIIELLEKHNVIRSERSSTAAHPAQSSAHAAHPAP